ncbi:MAG: methyltransferase domain-containing protein [Cytophagales bacterium]|nr:methyltransferase domain-containing protein [Rhizobacter sp.]
MSETSFEQAKAQFLAGLASLEAGQYAQAEAHFLSSLERLPGRISTLVNLAATRLKLRRPQEALSVADQVLTLEPDNRDALLHRANSLLELNRHPQALHAFERLLALEPSFAPAWSTCGDILRELGRRDEAAVAYRRALAHGADAELTGYYLAALGAAPQSPTGAPRAYVEALFDGYAGQFEQHVVQVLGYRAHEVLTQSLAALHPGRFSSALDLGCGTGLCGPLLKPLCDRLAGVDLSAQMLARAQALGVYDSLMHADVTEHLCHTDERHDLVLAADVFIYVGDLSAVFEAVSALMDPGGLFCFSVEVPSTETRGFELLPSLRYAHSEIYLRELAQQHGLEVSKLVREPIRTDQRQSIDGMFVCLTRH